jgi:hypothetical protein
MGAEEREIIIPVAVTVAGREVQIPITVPVGLDDLVQIVVDHLNTGTDIRELLVAHYAHRFYGDQPAEPSPSSGNGRRGAAGPPAFTDEELDGVDLDVPPRYSGKGKKSRQRLRWEAAMQRAGREV